MSKSTFFTGQPVLTQLLQLIPVEMVEKASRSFRCDRYYKKFKAHDHLVSMLFCGFNRCSSLRELITGLQANSYRLQHLRLKYTPRRSTLADANKKRPVEFFEAIFHGLVKKHYGILPDSLKGSKLHDRLFIIDSTTISLFCDVMKAAGYYRNGKKKGGVKAHTLMRLKDQVPSCIYLTESAKNDRIFMPMIKLPAHSILVMDKGYVNHKVMKQWSKDKITWVSRVNKAAKYEVVEQRLLSDYHKENGVRKDRTIQLGYQESKTSTQVARLIDYYDQSKKRVFTFITNNLELSPVTIATIYKKRWGIESLFRRVKQNFQLHNFLGDNENAIKIQVWCTLIADLLVAITKDKVDKLRKQKWSFSNLAGLIRLHLTTYINLIQFLINPDKAIMKYSKEINPNQQLTMFGP
jgi:hypothetical protein